MFKQIMIESVATSCVNFLLPLSWFIILAIVLEFIANRKTKDSNIWVTFLSGITVLFRLYLLAWMITLRQKDLSPIFDTESFREVMLIKLFLVSMTAVFIPIFALTIGKIWAQIKICGKFQSIMRLIPVFGMCYLFLKSLIFTINFVATFEFSL